MEINFTVRTQIVNEDDYIDFIEGSFGPNLSESLSDIESMYPGVTLSYERGNNQDISDDFTSESMKIIIENKVPITNKNSLIAEIKRGVERTAEHMDGESATNIRFNANTQNGAGRYRRKARKTRKTRVARKRSTRHKSATRKYKRRT